jgi:Mg/Co/Ni transporter MgtE
METPTGRYVGPVSFQRLLREAPSTPVSQCIDDGPEPVAPDLVDGEVARLVAAYDAVAVPVVDAAGRLLGAVTVDDVLDHVLPTGWRR